MTVFSVTAGSLRAELILFSWGGWLNGYIPCRILGDFDCFAGEERIYCRQEKAYAVCFAEGLFYEYNGK